MQQAIPYKSWQLPHYNTAIPRPRQVQPLSGNSKDMGFLKERSTSNSMLNMVSENAVIVFSKSGCCMSHVVRRLLLCLGVNPAVHEVEEEDELSVVSELTKIVGEEEEEEGGGRVQFPAVFIGGKFFGGLDQVMATHITGELVPILKKAGALWL